MHTMFWDCQGSRLSRDAQERANDLLMRHMTPEQQKSWLAFQAFVVVSQSGKSYRVKAMYSHNIWPLDSPYTYCLVLQGYRSMPLADHVLMQKLLLENDEDRFFKIAQRSFAIV